MKRFLVLAALALLLPSTAAPQALPNLSSVRVRLDNQPFSNQAGGRVAAVEGSRASDRIGWHMVEYLRRDTNGKYVIDAAATSASAPKLTSPGGATGTAVANVLGGDTEGWTLTYNEGGGNSNWSLAAQANGVAVPADAAVSENHGIQPAQGTTWTVTVAGKITITITQGATKFAAGDVFRLATFKTHSPGGKLNEIALTDFTDVKGDATDVP